MITAAGLWSSHPKLLFERVGGITVLERQLQTLKAAGITRVSVAAPKPPPEWSAPLRVPEGIELSWGGREAGGEMKGVTPPYLSVSGYHFIRPETLRYLATAPYKTHVTFTDGLDMSVLQVVPYRTEEMVVPRKVPLPAGSTVFLDASTLRQGPIMDWLLAMGFKSHDGFMARHFDRHLSLAVTRAVIESRLTPNAMTVMSAVVGLVGSALFLLTPACDVAAAALVWLHSVLDGCDGEMARIRFQETRRGADIDFWADNVVHVALFGCLAAGMARAGRSAAPLLGLAAVAGIVGSSGLTFWHRLRERRRGPSPEETAAEGSLLSRIETFLAQRDFIYLLVAMSLLDLTYHFLWAGAVGAPLFLAMMLAAGKGPAISTAKAPGEAL
ncbi:MAG: CDP-alcohol phosphatidyltransferase family protein [Elusimicrobia bacterium]|nr:CDP-alcohol phosphatidyltransferase family protein [Elusimicrobiota bacterium]